LQNKYCNVSVSFYLSIQSRAGNLTYYNINARIAIAA